MDAKEIQDLIDAAVTAKTAELRAELAATVEETQTRERMQVLNAAAYETTRLYTDPGTGYEYALIHLNTIEYNPISRRTEEELSPDDVGIKTLVEEIKLRGGLVRPLLVYRKGDNKYMLVKGARRLAALRAMNEEMAHAYILPAKPPLGMEQSWVNGY